MTIPVKGGLQLPGLLLPDTFDLAGWVDGDILAVDNDGIVRPHAPVGAEVTALAYNDTGTTQSISRTGSAGTTWVDVTGGAITVVADPREQWLYMQAGGVVAAIAAGAQTWLKIVETTGGATDRLADVWALTQSVGAPVRLGCNEQKLGVVASTRTFKLQAGIQTFSATTATWTLANGANTPSILRAEAK